MTNVAALFYLPSINNFSNLVSESHYLTAILNPIKASTIATRRSTINHHPHFHHILPVTNMQFSILSIILATLVVTVTAQGYA